MSQKPWVSNDVYIFETDLKGRIIGKAIELKRLSLKADEAEHALAIEHARLMAAAPELFEALKLVLDDNRLMNAMTKQQARSILDAVAKARGE